MEWVTLKGEEPNITAVHVGYLGIKHMATITEYNDRSPDCTVVIKNKAHEPVTGIINAKIYCNKIKKK